MTEEQLRRVGTPVPAQGGQTVLLAEDDLSVLVTTSALLGSWGYRVETATSGYEALEMIQSGVSVDLLLSDVMMPGSMNGFELAREVRKLYPWMPVIFMSGSTFQDEQIAEIGGPLLAKPVSGTNLARAINLALSERKNSEG